MTFSNLSSKIHQMTWMYSIVIVALLPFPIKNCKIPQMWWEEQRQTNREVMNEILQRILQLLNFKHNPSAKSSCYNVLCADGNFRYCKPVLAAWLPYCPEYSDLHHLEWHVCFWCECPKKVHGDYVPSDKQRSRQDHNLYRMLINVDTKAAKAELLLRIVHRGFSISWHIRCIVSNTPKPDLLRTMQMGMCDHLQMWIFYFTKTDEQLNKYNAIWSSVPAYHDLTPKKKSYEEVSPWNEKEMKEMSRYLLGVVTQSLRGRRPSQQPIFTHVIECTRAVLE